MTQVERDSINGLTQRFDMFLEIYHGDRKMIQETHDTVIASCAEQKSLKETVDRHTEEIEELKSQPGKKWGLLTGAIIGAIVGAIMGALSNLFK
jgi:uncharacterized membrane protein